MKLKVLVDNTVLQSQNFLGEHGLSFYIEDENKKILFDTGYSDAFLKNAHKMGIDLLNLDYIILSHGHYDHTWGLSHYLPFYVSNLKQGKNLKKPTIITHPDTFNTKTHEKTGEIGSIIKFETLKKVFDIKLINKPFKVTDNLTFLGEIPRKNDFENGKPIGKVSKNNQQIDDYILEDSALTYQVNDSFALITGCSHSGVCNIIEYAKTICKTTKIKDIIGGFHLVKANEERLSSTTRYLLKQNIENFHPCHCTDFNAKIYLSKSLELLPTGIGLELEY